MFIFKLLLLDVAEWLGLLSNPTQVRVALDRLPVRWESLQWIRTSNAKRSLEVVLVQSVAASWPLPTLSLIGHPLIEKGLLSTCPWFLNWVELLEWILPVLLECEEVVWLLIVLSVDKGCHLLHLLFKLRFHLLHLLFEFNHHLRFLTRGLLLVLWV